MYDPLVPDFLLLLLWQYVQRPHYSLDHGCWEYKAANNK